MCDTKNRDVAYKQFEITGAMMIICLFWHSTVHFYKVNQDCSFVLTEVRPAKHRETQSVSEDWLKWLAETELRWYMTQQIRSYAPIY